MSRNVLKGVHRRALGIGNDDEIIAKKGFTSGGDGTPSIWFPSHHTAAVFEDFLGDTGAPGTFTYMENDTGTGGKFSGVTVTGTNGVFRLTSGGGAGKALASTANLALTNCLQKQWKANSGGRYASRLSLTARVKLNLVSRTEGRNHVFVGFSDSGGAEFPAYDTGAGVISNAADLMGFLFSPGGDTGWSLIAAKSVAGDSGDQLAVAGSSYGPSTNTYTTLEMEYRTGISDTGGKVDFFIDGKKVGYINSPVTSTTALTPWIGLWTQDTDTGLLDVDYIGISAARDTGL